MSHMIRTGLYEISNYMYTNRYVYMSEENKLGFGREFGQSIQVEVLNNIQHLATLYDTATQLYLGCDVDEGKVKGYTDPQVLQLSSEDGIKFEIHPQDVNDLWHLKDGGNWTIITVGPAPSSEAIYWKFELVK